jgi:hypothetical protein
MLVDILHLSVRGNPGPSLYMSLVRKGTVNACLIEELHIIVFVPFLLLQWQEGGKNPSSVKLDFLLNSANEWPVLCVKASAQKASRAKVQKGFKNTPRSINFVTKKYPRV